MDDFPYVKVSKALREIVGEPIEGTRIYEAEGGECEVAEWSDAIFGEFDGLVSPGGVSMFAPVSRAAVHKRMKEGKLTAFTFAPLALARNWRNKVVGLRRTAPYVYIPVSECKAWAEDLQRRKREARNTGETMEQWRARRRERKGTYADLDDRFLKEGPSARRKRSKR